MTLRWAALALVPVALPVAADDATRWWSWMEYLASDALEGRNTERSEWDVGMEQGLVL